jgi:hypothetical protein
MTALSSLLLYSLSNAEPYSDIFVPAAPSPAGSDCTEYSLSYPAWSIENLHISQDSDSAFAEFKVTNTASGIVSRCSLASSEQETWTLCSDVTPSILGDHSTYFKASLTDIGWSLQMRETWLCDDLNPGRP